MDTIIRPINGLIKGQRDLFSVEYIAGGCDLIFKGRPEILVEMLYQAAQQYPHVAQLLITTTLIFADQKGIPLDQLKKHSWIKNGIVDAPGNNQPIDLGP